MSLHKSEQHPVAAQMAKGPVGILRAVRHAGRNLLSVISEDTRKQPYLKGPAHIHYVCDPEMITEILVRQPEDFPKSQVTRNVLGATVGRGLFLTEGQVWKAQRKRYAPLFAARQLPAFATYFTQSGAELADRISGQSAPFDIARLAQEASLTNISQVMFSGPKTIHPGQIRRGLGEFTDYVARMSLFDLMGLPGWVPRLKWLRSRAPVRDMRHLALDVILQRQSEQRAQPQDFLDQMIEHVKAEPDELEQVIDNLLAFVVAGHETSANTLAWALYLLALYPDHQRAMQVEIRAICGDDPPTFEALAGMDLLDKHLRETLRLYPAAALFARDAGRDIRIGSVDFAKGDAIFLPVYALHRHELLWREPDLYRPERFDETDWPRGQYIPFGDGPRVCIGAQYAQTEIKILMASVLQKVRLTVADAPIPEPVATLTLHPDGPLMLSAERL